MQQLLIVGDGMPKPPNVPVRIAKTDLDEQVGKLGSKAPHNTHSKKCIETGKKSTKKKFNSLAKR